MLAPTFSPSVPSFIGVLHPGCPDSRGGPFLNRGSRPGAQKAAAKATDSSLPVNADSSGTDRRGLRPSSFDTEFAHLVNQGSARQTEPLGCPITAVYHPIALVQDFQDIIAGRIG